MSAVPLRLLILGAHPDDAEFHAGGLILHYTRAGHVVKLVSANDLLVFAEALHSPQSVFSPRSARLVRAMGSLNESEDHATVGKEAK